MTDTNTNVKAESKDEAKVATAPIKSDATVSAPAAEVKMEDKKIV